MVLTPRPGILDVSPYVGGETTVPGVNRVMRLASNENPLGPSPKAAAAYAALQDRLHHYPDGAAKVLRAAIAKEEGLDAGRMVCGAGSDELIALLIRAYAGAGDEVLYSAHGFLMYPTAAKAAGATPVAAPERDLTADIEALLARISARTRIVFLANPNNPTGSYLSEESLRRLHDGLPETVLLVIDAAYAEYVTAEDYVTGAALVEDYDNVVMTRTFSKIYGLAALRLGWAYCPPAVVDVLNRIRGPFNVSQAALDAGVAAIEDQAHAQRSRQHNTQWLHWFSEAVRELGLQPYPSAGNFLLIRFPQDPGRSAAAALKYLTSRGILVRGMAGYGLPDCLRVTIGTEEEIQAVAEALSIFML